MVDRLTDKQAKEYRKLFKEYQNDRHEVEYRHLEQILIKLGHETSEMEMEIIYEDLDAYCNGSFTFSQFLNLMANKFSHSELEAKKKQKSEDEEALETEMREAFRVFDADGNGFISHAELKLALIQMDQILPDEEVEEMMHEADKDGDGQISFKEFCAMVPLSEYL